ncbi:MAG: helix-turn-helix transcriptional regulator [Bacillota bacterium]|nr:helix-turn-helix transcriptional regulator [Bacillota bacterium]
MGELKKLAFNFREWLKKCQQALDKNDCPSDALPVFSAEQFLKELSLAATNDKKAGLDPEPTLAGLAAIIRRHDRRVVREMETHSGAGVTVNRMNLLKQSHLGRLEAGILELLCKARIAKTLSRLRDSQGISLRQLEQRSGVSFSYLSQIERLGSSLPSSEILSSLDAALLSPSYMNVESGASLLRQRGDYDTAVQLVQQEEARLVSAWLQLMGGISYQAAPVKRSMAVQNREAQQGVRWTSPSGLPGSDVEAGERRPVTSSAVVGGGHEDADDESDEDDRARWVPHPLKRVPGGRGPGRVPSGRACGRGGDERVPACGRGGTDHDDGGPVALGQESGILTFELCDYFVELTPGIQRAVLRLVKDLARSHKGRSR